MKLKSLDSSLFTWELWRAFGFIELEISFKSSILCENPTKALLQKYAVGWADGSTVPCRPKSGYIAVMFFKDEQHFWFHLSRQEFERIYGNEA